MVETCGNAGEGVDCADVAAEEKSLGDGGEKEFNLVFQGWRGHCDCLCDYVSASALNLYLA